MFSDFYKEEFEDVSNQKWDELTKKISKHLTEASRLLKSDSITKFFATNRFNFEEVVDNLNTDLKQFCKEKVKISC